MIYPRAVALPFLQSLQAPGGWHDIERFRFRHTLGTTVCLKPSEPRGFATCTRDRLGSKTFRMNASFQHAPSFQE